MATNKTCRYYVLSSNEQQFVGHDGTGWYKWLDNLPWERPLLFRKRSIALRCADQMDGKVDVWPGFIPTSSPDKA